MQYIITLIWLAAFCSLKKAPLRELFKKNKSKKLILNQFLYQSTSIFAVEGYEIKAIA